MVWSYCPCNPQPSVHDDWGYLARLRAIFAGLTAVAQNLPVVLPLRTRTVLEQAGLYPEAVRHLRLIDPVGYLDMVMLEKQARLIITDSGGVQKEAFFYRAPCLTLREETEWVELGWKRIGGVQSGADRPGSLGGPARGREGFPLW